jgi:hypothetical protein
MCTMTSLCKHTPKMTLPSQAICEHAHSKHDLLAMRLVCQSWRVAAHSVHSIDVPAKTHAHLLHVLTKWWSSTFPELHTLVLSALNKATAIHPNFSLTETFNNLVGLRQLRRLVLQDLPVSEAHTSGAPAHLSLKALSNLRAVTCLEIRLRNGLPAGSTAAQVQAAQAGALAGLSSCTHLRSLTLRLIDLTAIASAAEHQHQQGEQEEMAVARLSLTGGGRRLY